jgi:hypothetical protein
MGKASEKAHARTQRWLIATLLVIATEHSEKSTFEPIGKFFMPRAIVTCDKKSPARKMHRALFLASRVFNR